MTDESKDGHISHVLAQALLDHTPRELFLRAVRAEAAYEREHRQCNDALNEAARLESARDVAFSMVELIARKRDETQAENERLREEMSEAKKEATDAEAREREVRSGVLGYKVRYPDGYHSWSPHEAFKNVHSPNGALDFSAALFLLKRGLRVRRAGWNAPHVLAVKWPDAQSKMRQPYIERIVPASRVEPAPWAASHADMMAEDWEIV